MQRAWWVLIACAVALLGLGGCRGGDEPSGPPEKLSIGATNYPGTALVRIASEAGFFKQAGLEVALQQYSAGKDALAAVLEGKADLATVADTPLMFAAMRGQAVSIVATIATSGEDYAVVARRDAGIGSPADLEGRRVAATLGTTGQYVLETMLAYHRVPAGKVVLVDLAPAALVGALKRAEVDAVSAWEPFLSQVVEGANGVAFPASKLYRATFNLAGTRGFVHARPEAMRRLVRALLLAERFAAQRPAEAQAMFARATGVAPATVARVWAQFTLRAALDQSLLTLLESQARWAMRQRLADQREMPNFLDAIYRDALDSVRPGSVTIIR